MFKRFQDWKIKRTKNNGEYSVQLDNVRFETELKKVNNDSKLLEARKKNSTEKFYCEQATSKIKMLEVAKTMKTPFVLYILMLTSTLITPMGYGVVTFLFEGISNNTSNIVKNILDNPDKTLGLLVFVAIQSFGFYQLSTKQIKRKFYNDGNALNTFFVIGFVVFSIYGDFKALYNWFGGNILEGLSYLIIACLLEGFILLGVQDKFNFKYKNLSFEGQEKVNMSIGNMIITILRNWIISKLFDRYEIAQENINSKNQKISEIKNNSGVNLGINPDENISLQDNTHISIDNDSDLHPQCQSWDKKSIDNNNNTNSLSDSRDNSEIKTNTEINPQNNLEIKNNSGINPEISSETKTKSEITKKQLKEIIQAHVKCLKDNERFDSSKLNYLKVSDSKIRTIRNELVKENILYTLPRQGTYKKGKLPLAQKN